MEPTALPPTTGVYQQIPLASIPTDEASQARVKIRPGVVRAYAQAMTQQRSEGGLRFPAVVLFTDGQHYWLGDGFHRILAARAAGLTDFAADVRPGTQRDALLYSISSNAAHGRRAPMPISGKPSGCSWPMPSGASGATARALVIAR